MFDGWAAANGIDPLELPLDRLMTTIHYYLYKDRTTDQKKELDSQINRQINKIKLRERAAQLGNRSEKRELPPQPVPSKGLPPAPSWWGGAEEATQSNKQVAASLRTGPDSSRKRNQQSKRSKAKRGSAKRRRR